MMSSSAWMASWVVAVGVVRKGFGCAGAGSAA